MRCANTLERVLVIHACFFFIQKQQLTQQLVENAFSALQLLHNSIPSDGSKMTTFFAGRPPEPEIEVEERKQEEEEEEEEGEGDKEGGQREEESGGENDTSGQEALQPPRAKRSRSQVRALDIQTVQVYRILYHCIAV